MFTRNRRRRQRVDEPADEEIATGIREVELADVGEGLREEREQHDEEQREVDGVDESGQRDEGRRRNGFIGIRHGRCRSKEERSVSKTGREETNGKRGDFEFVEQISDEDVSCSLFCWLPD